MVKGQSLPTEMSEKEDAAAKTVTPRDGTAKTFGAGVNKEYHVIKMAPSSRRLSRPEKLQS